MTPSLEHGGVVSDLGKAGGVMGESTGLGIGGLGFGVWGLGVEI